jgi:hypothetical protein
MSKVFEERQVAQGWLEGDMLIHLHKDEPAKSRAHGRLQGGDLVLPLNVKTPPEIESVSLEAKGDCLAVHSGVWAWEKNRVAAKGDICITDQGLHLDMELFTKDLRWKTIADAFGRTSKAEEGERAGWAFPLCGKIKLDAEHFRYDRFVWTPLRAKLIFTPGEMDVAISEANLCSIATPGDLRVTPHKMSLRVRPASTDQDLGGAYRCLLEEEKEMTGTFSLAGVITCQEKPEALLESAQGNLEFTAKDGRIYRYGLLAKVLAFVNLTEVFRGKVPDLAEEGLPYDSMEVDALVGKGKLVLERGLIMGPSVEIACTGAVDIMNKTYDLTYLVAPLKTLDSIAKKIPVLGRILGGTVVSIPVKVTGDWSDPVVEPLSASAVGSGVLGIMERALKLPVEVLESLPASEEAD